MDGTRVSGSAYAAALVRERDEERQHEAEAILTETNSSVAAIPPDPRHAPLPDGDSPGTGETSGGGPGTRGSRGAGGSGTAGPGGGASSASRAMMAPHASGSGQGWERDRATLVGHDVLRLDEGSAQEHGGGDSAAAVSAAALSPLHSEDTGEES